MNNIWFDNPKILIDKYYNIFPLGWNKISFNEKINSIGRLVIILAFILLLIEGYRILSIIIIIIYSIISVILAPKEKFTILTREGPKLKEVLVKKKYISPQDQIIKELKNMNEGHYTAKNNEFNYYANQHGKGMTKNYILQNYGNTGSHEFQLRKFNKFFS
jgi:hypothetical protein